MFLFDAEVTVTHEESFDVEKDVASEDEAREKAKEYAEFVVRDDLQSGSIPADAFDIEVTLTEVDDVDER